jgi:hypothetical protein
MFDANLCGVPNGLKVIVRFHGHPRLHQKCKIPEGDYECEMIDNDSANYNDNAIINVLVNGEVQTVHYPDVRFRWVTYEGEVK